MVAARRPVSCAISQAGPSDLLDSSYSSATRANVHDFAVAAFGERDLAAHSPHFHAGAIKGKVYAAVAENDQFPELVPRAAQWEAVAHTTTAGEGEFVAAGWRVAPVGSLKPSGSYEQHVLPAPSAGAPVCVTGSDLDQCMLPYVHGTTTGTAWMNDYWNKAAFAESV